MAKQAPTTVNLSLAAVTDFCTRTGRGQVHAEQMPLTRRPPKALSPKDGLRWLRPTGSCAVLLTDPAAEDRR